MGFTSLSNRHVIFLDIDGVLNNSRWGSRRSRDCSLLDPANVAAMNELLIAAGPSVAVVISSQWRVQMPLDDVVSYLRSGGFGGRIAGATPYLDVGPFDQSYCRGAEIDAWLAQENFTGCFVIIDDRDDMMPHEDRMVQTDYRTGFQPRQIQACLDLLQKPWVQIEKQL